MRALDIPITATVVMAMAIGGVYLGAAPTASTGPDPDAPPRQTGRTAELVPVSIPIYRGSERLGFCLVTARASLPNNFSDDEYQIAAARTNDDLIRALSDIGPDSDPRRVCVQQRNGQAGPSVLTKADFFLTVPDDPVGSGY